MAGALKRCNICNQPKPVSDFYRRMSGKQKGQLYPYCAECNTAACRDSRRYSQYRRLHQEGKLEAFIADLRKQLRLCLRVKGEQVAAKKEAKR